MKNGFNEIEEREYDYRFGYCFISCGVETVNVIKNIVIVQKEKQM